MSEVIHRVHTPFVAGLMMMDVSDTVDNGVPHVDVGGGHIYLCSQGLFAVLEFAGGHSCEEVKILLDRALSVGAVFARLGEGASVFPYLVGGKVADISLALFYELDGAFIDEVKVAGGVEDLIPLVAEPLDILLDGVDILDVLLGGVGVVKAQVAFAAVFLRRAEIYADSLCVADMQVAVRLGWETGLNSGVDPILEIFINKIIYKV